MPRETFLERVVQPMSQSEQRKKKERGVTTKLNLLSFENNQAAGPKTKLNTLQKGGHYIMK